MIDSNVLRSLLTFAIRRGLSLLGAGGMAVSDEWITQTVSLLILIGNELYQFMKAHQAKPQGSPEPTGSE